MRMHVNGANFRRQGVAPDDRGDIRDINAIWTLMNALATRIPFHFELPDTNGMDAPTLSGTNVRKWNCVSTT